jgi:beta-phosphoglucomutase
MNKSIKVILMDLDGVLVDACEWHYQSLNKALIYAGFGPIDYDDHLDRFNGLPTNNKLDILISDGKMDKNSKKRVSELKQNFTIGTIIDGAKPNYYNIEMLKTLRHLGYKIGCVTNSIRETACLMLSRTGQLDYMDTVISNQDVKNPKPNPEPYVKALEIFNLKHNQALAVEDSPKGIKSAIDAYLKVLEIKDISKVNTLNILKNGLDYTDEEITLLGL